MIAIISDIHSNLHALEAVLAEIKELDPQMIVCAGDLVGYGAFPNECCRKVEEVAGAGVVGNHDLAALTRDTSYMNPYAKKAAIWTADNLDPESRRYLLSLRTETRVKIQDMRLAMFHGSSRDVSEYVYEEDADDHMVTRAACEILIMGHTHVPYEKRTRSGLIVNPGSVGQPRDGDPQASYAVLDTERLSATIERVEYDIELAAKAITAAGLPRFLAERLAQGF